MKIEKIKTIPKYILARIKKADAQNKVCLPGRTRFYSYLTRNDGEIVKITVAVKTRYKQWLYKQVAVHGLNSDICYIKDMVFYYISGYSVGWYEQGTQNAPRWYESTEWDYSDDKYFDPFAPIVNREYLDKFPKYKYSAVNLYKGVNVLKYLRFYEKYPQIEYLMKAGLDGYAFSKQILQKIGKNKRFAKWLMKNRAELSRNDYNVDVVKASFRTGKPLAELQNIRKNQHALKKAVGISELRMFFKNDLEKFVTYLATQKTSVYCYNDYFRACNYLGLNMTEDKNRYPHDFKRWHDIRIDEYNTAKAMKDAEERKALYEKFAAVASKYLGLEYDRPHRGRAGGSLQGLYAQHHCQQPWHDVALDTRQRAFSRRQRGIFRALHRHSLLLSTARLPERTRATRQPVYATPTVSVHRGGHERHA